MSCGCKDTPRTPAGDFTTMYYRHGTQGRKSATLKMQGQAGKANTLHRAARTRGQRTAIDFAAVMDRTSRAASGTGTAETRCRQHFWEVLLPKCKSSPGMGDPDARPFPSCPTGKHLYCGRVGCGCVANGSKSDVLVLAAVGAIAWLAFR